MRHAVLRTLLPLLLLAQVCVGMSPGRVLCIVAECCTGPSHGPGHAHPHAHDSHAHRCAESGRDGSCTPAHHGHSHGHTHGHTQGDALGGSRPSERGSFACAAEPHDECCAHFHIAVPDHAGGSRDRAELRLAALRLLAPALAIGAPGSERGTGDRPREAPPPWCFATSDQCLARESMRLLI